MIKYIVYQHIDLFMRKSEFESNLDALKIKLNFDHPNNKLGIYINQVVNNVLNEKERVDYVDNRRAKSVTNHEIATSDQPLDDLNESFIEIPDGLIKDIKSELSDIEDILSRLANCVPSHDFRFHPKENTNMFEQINMANEEFKSLVYNNGSSEFIAACNRINITHNLSKKEVNKFKSKVEHMRDNINYILEIIDSIVIPDNPIK